jgi:hypothetical protein
LRLKIQDFTLTRIIHTWYTCVCVSS